MQWASVILRFGLYTDLGLLFGVPFFALYSFKSDELAHGITRFHSKLVLVLAYLGIFLSIASLISMAANMSGAVDWFVVDRQTLSMVISGTAFGSAWLIRIFALALTVLMLLKTDLSNRFSLSAVSILAGIALMTLAWAGHAVMDDGFRRYMHLSVDFVHMIAAATWLGALLAFVILFKGKGLKSPAEIRILERVISGFAPIGSIVVGLLVVTGLFNYVLIVGFSLPDRLYGELLLIKLILFGLMLLLAAANRFRLGPMLDMEKASENTARAIKNLRRSLRIETTVAFLVLAVVAILGIQTPSI